MFYYTLDIQNIWKVLWLKNYKSLYVQSILVWRNILTGILARAYQGLLVAFTVNNCIMIIVKNKTQNNFHRIDLFLM